MSDRVIEFFFDVGSPYTYLAATQVTAIEARTGVRVRHRPFLLGGVFKATGNTPPAQVASRGRWMVQDLGRWAAKYGVPFAIASRFPLNTLATQRVLAAAERTGGEAAVRALALPLFRAFWVEDRDVSSPAVLVEVANACGLDGTMLVESANAPETKELLRASTEEAVARGAFGAPSFFVGDQLFFGNDRIGHLEDLLASH
ncbi:2-hydroxychromene-2-carboxylate isomerase [Sandaracinus amylolyticus]|uniref:2-hydroxychromene-2-carboxylate isomerase n=1 Tax=Sandaracinus amylolyticus TaxID=927083 RepID=A0A0F6W7D0_9BACT|nr:2-hydroxychromene-2-carboxylate isomerase [Sandaracinus amylolyticus]AKF09286.1 2-hydroxychromene-2-carboxylate isomerase family protein, glutathione-dependent [Sandaracinus amylolyticus]